MASVSSNTYIRVEFDMTDDEARSLGQILTWFIANADDVGPSGPVIKKNIDFASALAGDIRSEVGV